MDRKRKSNCLFLYIIDFPIAAPKQCRDERRTEKKAIVNIEFVFVDFLTINSRRNLSSSRAAVDVLFKCCWILAVPLLLPLMFKLFTETVAFVVGFSAAPDVDIKFSGPRRSRRSSSSCLVSASTFATAKLSSFSFSLNKARIESRSLPGEKRKKKKTKTNRLNWISITIK